MWDFCEKLEVLSNKTMKFKGILISDVECPLMARDKKINFREWLEYHNQPFPLPED